MADFVLFFKDLRVLWGGSRIGEEGFVPVFPDGVDALESEHFGDLCGGAGVVDLELFGGFFAAGFLFEFDAAAFDG